MVSLRRDHSSPLGGGTVFSDASVHSTDSDTQNLLHPVVGQSNVKSFTPLNTIPAVVALLIFAVGMEILVITFTALHLPGYAKCEPYFFFLYAHAVYWAFSLITHQHLQKQHRESRIKGYLEFHQQSSGHAAVPFYITSIWNALILVVAAIFHNVYGDINSRCESHAFSSPVNYMCFIITVENVVMIPVVITYILKVSRFNNSKMCPDAQKDEWMSSFIQDSYSGGEVGYRERDNHVEDLLEKQADLLRYLKEQNTRLSQKVMILSTQLHEKHDAQIT